MYNYIAPYCYIELFTATERILEGKHFFFLLGPIKIQCNLFTGVALPSCVVVFFLLETKPSDSLLYIPNGFDHVPINIRCIVAILVVDI